MIAIAKGILRFFSERGHGRPFVNCVEAAACAVLRWAGWLIPDDYPATLRGLTGVPLTDKKGHPRGTSYAELQIGLKKAFPAAFAAGLFHFEWLAQAAIVALLPEEGHPRHNRKASVVSFGVHCPLLPDHLARLVGRGYTGGHEMAFGARRMGPSTHDASLQVQQVYLLDPMGKIAPQPPQQPYVGEWIDIADVWPAVLKDSTGAAHVFSMARNSAIN